MWMFYFLFWSAVRANEEPLYRKIGDNVVLTPDSVENPITSIRWKHGPHIAMQLNGDETSSYRQFKDRGSLNISTGVMTITGLTRDDSGIYTVEINGKETNSQTELLVISPVPKPSLSVSCVPEMTYCVFTCSGSITEPAPVTYWWTAGEKMWNSTNQHKITKEEKERWFSCTLKNPVSFNISEEVFNPFITYRTWIEIMPIVVGVFLIVCIIIIIYFIYRCRKERAANRTPKERKVMLSGVKNTSNQDLTSVDVPDTSSGSVEKPGSPPFMKEASTQTSTAPPEASNETGFKPQWQYERESGGWWDFRETTDPLNGCSVTNNDVERWYQEKPHSKMPFTVKGIPYKLDFDEMNQTNLETETKRKVRRMMLPPSDIDIGVSCSDSPL